MKKQKRLLFIGLHREGRSPSQRFRFDQFMPYLKQKGWHIDYAPVLNEADDRIFYTPSAYLRKAWIVAKGYIGRLKLLRSINSYDAVFVQRESFMLGSTFFERRLSKANTKFVYDFDDAIWLLDVSDANKNLSWLKDPSKTQHIIQLAHHVIAGNAFLAGYAQQWNRTVDVIPTVIDTDLYKSSRIERQKEVIIGWSGSQTTNKHFKLAIGFLTKLKEKYGDQIKIMTITERRIDTNGLEVEYVSWDKSREVQNLDQIDIGIMPLPDDEWSKGKCGFKGIQYMSLSKPAVMSPVGVNPEIVEHGVSGFLPANEDEWVECLSTLIDSPELRTQMGEAARNTIEQHYSVHAVKDRLLQVISAE